MKLITGKTVLTYLVWSTVDQLGLFPTNILPQDKATIPSAAQRLKLKPYEINETSLLSHGVRHFRFLKDQKEATILDANLTDDIEATVGRLEPAVAGQID
ncbi:MAG: hypothetical protein ACUVWY_14975 [Desulfosoma sp.]|uniref:hypothetical protein n=1 Tax=Desulfosoma sp. TaxID=2603217 RepID=UPI00404A2A9F